jgi:hypothetical protein
MTIFANVLEILHSHCVTHEPQAIYPALQVLSLTVPHLTRAVFD